MRVARDWHVFTGGASVALTLEEDLQVPEDESAPGSLAAPMPGKVIAVMVKPGDKVTIIASPLRNGEPAALLKQITLADGRKFSNGAAAGRATIE